MMSMAKASAFDNANAASLYGKALENNGFQAVITGPLDTVLIDKPGSQVGGWSEVGKSWYLVIGSTKEFTAVP